MKEKILKRDDSVIISKSEKEFLALAEKLSAKENWHNVYADEVKSFGVSNTPILAEVEISEKQMEETVSVDSFTECVGETGIFVSFPYEDKYITYPTRYTSNNSLLDRSGTNCRMVKTISSKGYVTALSAEQRGEEINRGFQYSKEPLKIYVVDEKVSFFGSCKYVILPYDEGLNTVKQYLDKEFPEAEFVRGEISHEYIFCDYRLNSEEEESLAMKMQDFGVLKDTDKVELYLRFSSSNVGNAKMSVRLLAKLNGVKAPLGDSLNIWHHSDKFAKTESLTRDNGCEIKNLETKLTWLAMLIRENEDLVEKLGNTTINNPAGCLQHITKDCNKISAKDRKKAIEDFDMIHGTNPCTAIEVYIAISSIIGYTDRSPKEIINMMEEIAQLQCRNFSDYDKPLKEED